MQLQAPYPKPILYFKNAVLAATLVYASWFGLRRSLQTGGLSPDILLLPPTFGWSVLWRCLTSALILPYPGLQLSMIFDLALIHFFLTPIATFVHVFLGTRQCGTFIVAVLLAGIVGFYASAAAVQSYPEPASLFSGLAAATVLFWTLLHSKGQHSMLFVFPVSRVAVLSVTLIAALLEPMATENWPKGCAIVCMALTSYLLGVSKWRLRSYVGVLASFESIAERTYRSCARFIQWRLLGTVRRFFSQERP